MLAHLLERLQKNHAKDPIFTGIKRGIEREALRTNKACQLSQTPHPRSLGAKLTHPQITTDYSENLLEFITPVATNVDTLLTMLDDIHAYVYANLGDEYLWPTSMPCILGSDQDIPIADYGTSNSGQMKMHYRRGLGYRYGRHMQTIAGLHYNFSLPDAFWDFWFKHVDPGHETLRDCIDTNYMRLIRNVHRHGWLIYYLYGNSVAVDKSFITQATPKYLSPLGKQTLVNPTATTLRMSDMGYKSSVQEEMHISYNTIQNYANDLLRATQQPVKRYQAITEQFGPMAQLNANMVQIEAEYYSPIRPKRTVGPCQRPVYALKEHGIEYIELRALDVDSNHPAGISREQVHFLDTFLMFCLLSNSPGFCEISQADSNQNQITVALNGRDPNAKLSYNHHLNPLHVEAIALMEKLKEVAAFMDEIESTQGYSAAMNTLTETVHAGPEALKSAKQLRDIESSGEFIRYAQALAEQHKTYYQNHRLDQSKQAAFEAMARQSWDDLKHMEANDSLSYEDYVKCYFRGQSSSTSS